MKKKALAVFFASAVAAPLSFAGNFEGFAVGVDLGVKSTGGKYTSTQTASIPGAEWSDRTSETLGGDYEFVTGLDINYGFALGSDVVLRVGATYDFNDTDIDSFSYSSSGPGWTYRERATLEENDHFSVYIAPGLLIGERTLAYVKLAHHRMEVKGKYSESFHDANGALISGMSGKASEKFEGWGFGAGIETQLSTNIFFTAEVQHVRYNSETLFSGQDEFGVNHKDKARPTSTIGTLGLSYRF